MFVEPNFLFNGIYSKNLGVSIATFDNSIFHSVGISYTSELQVETDITEYSPYFKEVSSETDEIELNLVLYDPMTMLPLSIDDFNMDELYDWLITDDFCPFISDDDVELVYYFKTVRIEKVLTFNKMGYLKVVFRPYSKYAYRCEEYEIEVNGVDEISIYNPSRIIYKPIIELVNLGDSETANFINDMCILGLNQNEIIKIDNLTKIVIDENNENKFSCCNRKWIELTPREENIINVTGRCRLKIICEFPIIQ